MSYYLKGLNRRKLIVVSITCLGISSIVTQILMMRELVNVARGNEMVYGVILGNWLFLTGLGSYLGKFLERFKNVITIQICMQIAIALLPIGHLLAIRILRDILFIRGSVIDIAAIIYTSFILLAPFCLIAGSLLTIACFLLSSEDSPHDIAKIYFVDSIGDVFGGLLFSFILVFWFSPFETAFIIFALNILAVLLLVSVERKALLGGVALVLLVLVGSGYYRYDIDSLTIEKMYPGVKLVDYKESLFGRTVVTESAGQLNFFENNKLLFATDNEIENEKAVHYAMVQHKAPKNVLLLSGGVSGTIGEILKYDIKRIDYVEIDPVIIMLGQKYTRNLDSPLVNVVMMDARLFLKQTKRKYDVVIIALGSPDTAQVNRFYTVEFFSDLKRLLNKNGIVSCHLEAAKNYLSDELRMLYSSIYKTLNQVFKNIIIIPDSPTFFVGSDGELSYEIGKKIAARNIPTITMNSYYLDSIITQKRIDWIINALTTDVKVNEDFKPIAYYFSLKYFLSYFKYDINKLAWFILIVFFILMVSLHPITAAVTSAGLTCMGLELVAIIGFQIIYGYAYYQVGLIVTGFILGLAIGSHIASRMIERVNLRSILAIILALILLAAFLPVFLNVLKSLDNELTVAIMANGIPIYGVVLSCFIGALFPIAAKLNFRGRGTTAATLYAADHIGSSIGALLLSTMLIPLLGIFNVCFLLAGLNVISIIRLWRYGNKMGIT